MIIVFFNDTETVVVVDDNSPECRSGICIHDISGVRYGRHKRDWTFNVKENKRWKIINFSADMGP